MNTSAKEKKVCFLIALSGKRFAGKDFIASQLLKAFVEKFPEIHAQIIRQADELKRLYAESYQADYQSLITDREYKELHREKQTEFYLKTQDLNPTLFCEKIVDLIKLSSKANNKNLSCYFLADLRHKFEVAFYRRIVKEELPSLKSVFVRIEASESTREGRGWKKLEVVDSGITETNLDDFDEWDLVIENNEKGEQNIDEAIEYLLNMAGEMIKNI